MGDSKMNKNKERKFDISVNTPPEGYKASLRSRTIVAIILLIIFVPSFFLGGYFFFAAVSIFVVLAILEMIFAPHRRYGWYVYLITFLVTLTYIYWTTFKANIVAYMADPENFVFSLESKYFSYGIPVFGICASLVLYFLVAILDKNFDFSDVAYFFTFTLLIGLGFQAAYALRYYSAYMALGPFKDFVWFNGLSSTGVTSSAFFQYFLSACPLILMVGGALFNDTAAYFGGIYFGKHKMNERVSPHKTWEGFAFGVAGGFLFSFIFMMVLAGVGYPILPFLTLDKWYWILLISILIPLMGDLGDLSFSLIKRFLHIKDYGNVLKGHGGILDRVDSILFCAICLMMVFTLIERGWNLLS